jgi:hypothetical protein
MNQDDKTNYKIGDDDSEDTGDSTMSSDIDEENLDNQEDVLHLGQACRGMSFCTTRVQLPKERSHTDIIIARPLLPNSRYLPATMALPQLKHKK